MAESVCQLNGCFWLNVAIPEIQCLQFTLSSVLIVIFYLQTSNRYFLPPSLVECSSEAVVPVLIAVVVSVQFPDFSEWLRTAR